MVVLTNHNILKKLIVGFYFTFASIVLSTELFFFRPSLLIFKSVLVLLLGGLYWSTSTIRSPFFFLTVFSSLIAYLFFFSNNYKMLFLGIIAFLIYRLLTIFYIIKLIKLKSFLPVLIAINPFLFVFFYFFTISYEIPNKSHYVLIAQNILICILGALSLSYFALTNLKKPWLLWFGLLSVALYFIEFIKKYYFFDISLSTFRFLEIILNTAVYYTFYEFVMQTEKDIP